MDITHGNLICAQGRNVSVIHKHNSLSMPVKCVRFTGNKNLSIALSDNKWRAISRTHHDIVFQENRT